MFARVASTFVAISAAVVSVNALTVSTPSDVSRCQEVTFDVNGAVGPVFFTVLPAQNTCESDSIAEIGPITITDGKYTWTPDLALGTEFVILIDDTTTGEEAWSAPIAIGGSPDACVADASSAEPSSTSTTYTAPPANTNRPFTTNNNGNGSGNDNDVDTPENAAEGPEDTTGAAIKTQVPMSLLVVVAGVVAAFA